MYVSSCPNYLKSLVCKSSLRFGPFFYSYRVNLDSLSKLKLCFVLLSSQKFELN